MVDLTIDSEWAFTDLQQSIVDQLKDTSGISAKEIAHDLDMTKQYVLKILDRLESCNSVIRIEGAGDEGAGLYILDDKKVENGDLDLSQL
jgi:DNA-binding MarR family transcriptional regulator